MCFNAPMSKAKALTTSDIARLAQLSHTAVREWSKELAAVLSPEANPPPGTMRYFSMNDALVYNTARVMRMQGHGWGDVIASIKNGSYYELEEVEEDTAVEEEAGEEATTTAGVVDVELYERITAPYRAHIDELAGERDYLRERLEEAHGRVNELTGKAARGDADRERLEEIKGELAAARAEAEAARLALEQERGKTWWDKLRGK